MFIKTSSSFGWTWVFFSICSFWNLWIANLLVFLDPSKYSSNFKDPFSNKSFFFQVCGLKIQKNTVDSITPITSPTICIFDSTSPTTPSSQQKISVPSSALFPQSPSMARVLPLCSNATNHHCSSPWLWCLKTHNTTDLEICNWTLSIFQIISPWIESQKDNNCRRDNSKLQKFLARSLSQTQWWSSSLQQFSNLMQAHL